MQISSYAAGTTSATISGLAAGNDLRFQSRGNQLGGSSRHAMDRRHDTNGNGVSGGDGTAELSCNRDV